MSIVVHPCPFCDYDDVQIDEIDMRCFAVVCPECECIGPVARDARDNALNSAAPAGRPLE